MHLFQQTISVIGPIVGGIIVLANSSYVIGPLWGEGGSKILVYYVFGFLELPIGNWKA